MKINGFDERLLLRLSKPYCIDEIYELMLEYNFSFGDLELVGDDDGFIKTEPAYRKRSHFLQEQTLLILKPTILNLNAYIKIYFRFNMFDRPSSDGVHTDYHRCRFLCEGICPSYNYSMPDTILLDEWIECNDLDLQGKLKKCLDVCNAAIRACKGKTIDEIQDIRGKRYEVQRQQAMLDNEIRKGRFCPDVNRELYEKAKIYHNIIK